MALLVLLPAYAFGGHPESEAKVRAMFKEESYPGFVEAYPDDFVRQDEEDEEKDASAYLDLREARLVNGEDALVLRTVGMKTIELPYKQVMYMTTPDPSGAFGAIKMARWILDEAVIDIIMRSDSLIAEEAKSNFGGALNSAPRFYIRVRDRDSQNLLAEGFVNTAAQAQLWKDLQNLFPRLTVTYRSYASELKAECDDILKGSVIRAR